MIELKDLKNRNYIKKVCYGFEYRIENFIFKFERLPDEEKDDINLIDVEQWKMLVIPPDGELIRIGYELPKHNLSLPMICAIGLKYYQRMLKAEIQIKSMLDFKLGDSVAGMIE